MLVCWLRRAKQLYYSYRQFNIEVCAAIAVLVMTSSSC